MNTCSHRTEVFVWLALTMLSIANCSRSEIGGQCEPAVGVGRVEPSGTVYLGPPESFGNSVSTVRALPDDTVLVVLPGPVLARQP